MCRILTGVRLESVSDRIFGLISGFGARFGTGSGFKEFCRMSFKQCIQTIKSSDAIGKALYTGNGPLLPIEL